VRAPRRGATHGPDPTTAVELDRIADEIDHRVSLAAVTERLSVERSVLKRAADVAAERIGRLELNGRLVRASPLSIVVELEALIRRGERQA
jgi:hypothetical protein